jgi:hypothetical protein
MMAKSKVEDELERYKKALEEARAENKALQEQLDRLRRREFGPMTMLGIDIAQELRDQFFAETTVEERRALLKKGAEMLRDRIRNYGKKKTKKES